MLFRKYRKIQKNRPGRGEKKCIFAVRIHSNSFILKHFLYWFPFLVSAYSPDFSLRLRRFLFFLFPCFGLSDPRFFPYSPEIPIFSGLFPRIRWPTPHPPPYRTWRFGAVHRIGEIRDPMRTPPRGQMAQNKGGVRGGFLLWISTDVPHIPPQETHAFDEQDHQNGLIFAKYFSNFK